MNKKILKKLHLNNGFSLAELLVAILILLMVSSIVAVGIPVAREAYLKVVLASNADVLLSTTVSTLRNELGTAQNVKVDEVDGTTITYYSPTRGTSSRIYLEGNAIKFQRYFYDSSMSPGTVPSPEPLIQKAAMSDGLYVKYDSVDKPNSDGVLKIRGLTVYRNDGTKMTERTPFSIQIVSYEE